MLITSPVLNNNYGEGEIEINIRYVSNRTGLRMIVDSGAPFSIVSNKWIDRYVKEMEMVMEDIDEKSCRKHFRCEENVHESTKELKFPIVIKTNIGDYIR